MDINTHTTREPDLLFSADAAFIQLLSDRRNGSKTPAGALGNTVITSGWLRCI